MTKKIKKVISIVIVCILLLCVVITAVAGNYFYNLALNPKTDKSEIFDADHNKSADKPDSVSNKVADIPDVVYTDVYIQSFDNLKLHGLLIENNSNTWIINVHGYTGQAKETEYSSGFFYEMGYNILKVDCRAHGDSEGDYIGMGWHDRLDIVGWVDYITTNYPDANIVLYGVSMGAATVMMTSGEDLPANVKAIVEDCGYTSVYDEFKYQLSELFNLKPFPVLDMANIVTKIRAGYDLKQSSAIEQVKKSKVPILFIHGTEDTFVPTFMVYELYDAATVPKELLIIENAGHGQSAVVDPVRYWDTVSGFINKYIE